tara:strand:- start:103 stop:744 length:642 start_codon:yes stop_codon:yes gene_type:complete
MKNNQTENNYNPYKFWKEEYISRSQLRDLIAECIHPDAPARLVTYREFVDLACRTCLTSEFTDVIFRRDPIPSSHVAHAIFTYMDYNFNSLPPIPSWLLHDILINECSFKFCIAGNPSFKCLLIDSLMERRLADLLGIVALAPKCGDLRQYHFVSFGCSAANTSYASAKPRPKKSKKDLISEAKAATLKYYADKARISKESYMLKFKEQFSGR